MVARGIPRNPLKGVDSAQADVQSSVSKLVNGSRETLGDLSLKSGLQLFSTKMHHRLRLHNPVAFLASLRAQWARPL
jgi:hypothetical protein